MDSLNAVACASPVSLSFFDSLDRPLDTVSEAYLERGAVGLVVRTDTTRDPTDDPVSYTHLTLPTTPYV